MSRRTDEFLKALKENPNLQDCPAYSFAGHYFNDRQKGIFEQLVMESNDTGNAPYVLFPEDYWDIASRTEPENIPDLITPYTYSVTDPENRNAIDHFLDALEEFSKEDGEVGDIAYIAEIVSKRALGLRLTTDEKKNLEAFKERNCPDLVKTSWNDMNLTYALAVEEFCRNKGINVEITAALDSGKCSMTFESIMDSVRAGAFGRDTETFKMMEESVKQLCLIDENGVLSVQTKTELRQVDTFDDKRADLEKTLKDLFQKAATDREAADKLRILQRQMVEACHRLEREKTRTRAEQRRNRFLQEQEKKDEEERANEEAERYYREHNTSIGRDCENPVNAKRNALVAMAKVFILAGFMNTTIKEPLGEAFKTHALLKITDIQKTEAALANAGKDILHKDNKGGKSHTQEKDHDEVPTR